MTRTENIVFSTLRVLEIAGELGAYTGKMFADLGADVIRIEGVDGDPTRKRKPYFNDIPGKENSLRYQYLNTNKKSIVLDLNDTEARDIFLNLIRTSDLLIESCPPGYLDKSGLGYEKLSQLKPKLVHTAITPYGQFGPNKDYPFSDLTCLAMGGMLYLAGIGDEKPARVADNQSFFQADLYAAYASIVAVFHADSTGEGQFIDVSIQESVATALETAIQAFDLEGQIRRSSLMAGYGPYKCLDGYVYVIAIIAGMWNPLVNWLIEENIPDAQILTDDKWKSPKYLEKEEAISTFKRIFETFAQRYPKQVLYEISQKRKIVIYPINTPKDILENSQLIYRKFFKKMHVDSLGNDIVYPGAPYYLEKIPWRLKTAAPVFGQHTERILIELGYSMGTIVALVKRGAAYVK